MARARVKKIALTGNFQMVVVLTLSDSKNLFTKMTGDLDPTEAPNAVERRKTRRLRFWQRSGNIDSGGRAAATLTFHKKKNIYIYQPCVPSILFGFSYVSTLEGVGERKLGLHFFPDQHQPQHHHYHHQHQQHQRHQHQHHPPDFQHIFAMKFTAKMPPPKKIANVTVKTTTPTHSCDQAELELQLLQAAFVIT